MEEIAPGSILQRMYFKRRIARLKPRTFCEIGSGNGILSNILLEEGANGVGFDLNEGACANNSERNAAYIADLRYKVLNKDFLTYAHEDKYDLIFSCMVIEHLDENQVADYFRLCKELLTPKGTIVLFVPSSMSHWGVEDEIAGHFRRYEFTDLEEAARKYKLRIHDLSGLTYPISNWLLILSNRLVRKNEGHKKELSMQEQTILSGNRGIRFKTVFPAYMKLVLNEWVMFPFFVLQRLFKSNRNSLVLYCEFQNL